MKSEAQNALVEIYRTIERLGHNPTNGSVFTLVRSLGYKFKDIDAKVLLANERRSA